MLVNSKTKPITYDKLAIAFILFTSASHSVCAESIRTESIRTATIAVSAVDMVGKPRGLTLRIFDKFNNVVAEASNVSSSVFNIKEGSYDVTIKCPNGDTKHKSVTILHDCAKNEPAGSLCQGETAVVSIACN